MKSLGKVFALIALAVLLVVVALLFALTHLFNPNDYKDEIQQLAREKANIELTLNGDIGWSLFPWLGIELTDATIASADTPDLPLAELRQLGLFVRLLPLLRSEIQMSDVHVDGLDLTLQRLADGRANWQGIGRPSSAQANSKIPAPDADAASATQAPSGKSSSLKLDIDSLNISHSRVVYQDAQQDQQYTLEGIELKTGTIRPESNIDIKLSAFFGTNQPVLRARSELTGQLRFDSAFEQLQLEDLKINGEVSGEPLAGKTLTFNAQSQISLDLAKGTGSISGLKLAANRLNLLGEFELSQLQTQATVSGAFSIAQLNLRAFLEGIGQNLPSMRDTQSLSQFELASKIKGSSQSLMLEELELKLDGSTFNGSAGLSNLANKALRADLKGDQLLLDRYLPPKDKSQDSARRNEVKQSAASAGKSGTTELPNKPSQHAWSEKPLLPVDSLRRLDAQISLSLGQLMYDNLKFDQPSIKVRSKDGLISLNELRTGLNNGSIASTGQLDLRQAEPLFSLKPIISHMPIEPLLKDDNVQAPIRGDLSLEANLSARGNSEKALVDSLSGNASFNLLNGVLVDANLEQQLCRGIALLNRKDLSQMPSGKDTPFRELKGNLTLSNGVAHNPNFIAALPGLTLKGHGDLDLRVLGVDYRLGIIIEGDQRAMPDAACAVGERYVGIEWPIRCRGPLELGAKACRLDQDGLGKIAARLAGNKLTEKLEEKLGDKVSPDLKDALKKLFR